VRHRARDAEIHLAMRACCTLVATNDDAACDGAKIDVGIESTCW
jgi:hypothetical protein